MEKALEKGHKCLKSKKISKKCVVLNLNWKFQYESIIYISIKCVFLSLHNKGLISYLLKSAPYAHSL